MKYETTDYQDVKEFVKLAESTGFMEKMSGSESLLEIRDMLTEHFANTEYPEVKPFLESNARSSGRFTTQIVNSFDKKNIDDHS